MTAIAAMRHSGGNRRCPEGFTLIDLAMSLAALGVVLAIAIPRYADSIVRYRLDAAASRVAADLALAQSNARIRGLSQAVVFDLAANQIRLPGYADPDRPESTYTVRLGEAPYQAALAEANFSGGNTITFNGFGDPLVGGSVVVRVGDTRRTVFVNRVTGKASIQ